MITLWILIDMMRILISSQRIWDIYRSNLNPIKNSWNQIFKQSHWYRKEIVIQGIIVFNIKRIAKKVQIHKKKLNKNYKINLLLKK